MERTCKKCGETKSIDEFKRSTHCKLGYSYQCKKCRSKYDKSRIINNVKKLESQKKYRNSQKGRKKWAEYYENNKSDILTYHKNINKQNHHKLTRERRKILTDGYLVSKIRQNTGINTDFIYKYPELIEAKRIQLQLKRLANENRNRP